MKMEQEFDFEFTKMYPYVETSVMKQKDAAVILNTINSGRLKHHMKFNCYGECHYDEDDKQMNHAYVTRSDKFNRLRTNVLVFDMYDNDWNPGIYDKLYIFKSNNVNNPTFSIVAYNTITKKAHHHPQIEYAYDILLQTISRLIFTIHRKCFVDFYYKKEKMIADKTPTNGYYEKDFKKIMEFYENAQYDDPKNVNNAV